MELTWLPTYQHLNILYHHRHGADGTLVPPLFEEETSGARGQGARDFPDFPTSSS